jgi:DNA-directed RNA polymerase specialized sigma24 family protein
MPSETILRRAWKAFDRFEGRAALRSWLYRIATNVCLDMIAGRARRAGRWAWALVRGRSSRT